MIGGELASDGVAVVGTFAMQILISGAAPDFVHDHHPEVISVDTERTNSLLEREFDLEAQAVESDHLNGVHSEVGR